MHKVSIISMIIGSVPRLRFEINLADYDLNLQHKLRKMGFNHIGRGTYMKELRNVDEMKDRYEFNMEFINREFNKDNIEICKLVPVTA